MNTVYIVAMSDILLFNRSEQRKCYTTMLTVGDVTRVVRDVTPLALRDENVLHVCLFVCILCFVCT